MKKRYWILIGLLLLAGAVLILYPRISNWWAVRNQDTTIRLYEREVETLSPEELEILWAEARAYNDALPPQALTDPFGSGGGGAAEYLATLNVDGVMGYVDVPAIGVSLPIRHGSAESVIRSGAGHLYGSSLPIGGEGTHAVLTSHSGLASARLFTDLDELVPGDLFYIRVLDETLAYEVDQILVVEPHETGALYPVAGEDYVTLITCTPYAINSHRLLVRGTRVDYTPPEGVENLRGVTVGRVNWAIVALVMGVGIALVRTGIARRRKKRAAGGGEGGGR